MGGPLLGIRVLDATRALAGPLCTMVLGDLGADVIKLEMPGVGDETRLWGPPFAGDAGPTFVGFNRNKRSVALDLHTSQGRDTCLALSPASATCLSRISARHDEAIPSRLRAMRKPVRTSSTV
jgi:crotonobetainyl-CoA:carnitine CoA-transferase CaiB-like acyl-CoA transferase